MSFVDDVQAVILGKRRIPMEIYWDSEGMKVKPVTQQFHLANVGSQTVWLLYNEDFTWHRVLMKDQIVWYIRNSSIAIGSLEKIFI
jgi:hypothetical protein